MKSLMVSSVLLFAVFSGARVFGGEAEQRLCDDTRRRFQRLEGDLSELERTFPSVMNATFDDRKNGKGALRKTAYQVSDIVNGMNSLRAFVSLSKNSASAMGLEKMSKLLDFMPPGIQAVITVGNVILKELMLATTDATEIHAFNRNKIKAVESSKEMRTHIRNMLATVGAAFREAKCPRVIGDASTDPAKAIGESSADHVAATAADSLKQKYGDHSKGEYAILCSHVAKDGQGWKTPEKMNWAPLREECRDRVEYIASSPLANEPLAKLYRERIDEVAAFCLASVCRKCAHFAYPFPESYLSAHEAKCDRSFNPGTALKEAKKALEAKLGKDVVAKLPDSVISATISEPDYPYFSTVDKLDKDPDELFAALRSEYEKQHKETSKSVKQAFNQMQKKFGVAPTEFPFPDFEEVFPKSVFTKPHAARGPKVFSTKGSTH